MGKLRPREVKCPAQAGWRGGGGGCRGAGRRSSPGSALGDVSPDNSGTLTLGGDVLTRGLRSNQGRKSKGLASPAQPSPAHSTELCSPGLDTLASLRRKRQHFHHFHRGPERLSDLHQVTQQKAMKQWPCTHSQTSPPRENPSIESYKVRDLSWGAFPSPGQDILIIENGLPSTPAPAQPGNPTPGVIEIRCGCDPWRAPQEPGSIYCLEGNPGPTLGRPPSLAAFPRRLKVDGALRSLWCCLGVSATALMNTTAESAFLASSFLGIRLQGARLPAQPAQLCSVDLQALQPGSSTASCQLGRQRAPSHSELSSNVTSSGRPSLTTLYELAHLLAVSPSPSV